MGLGGIRIGGGRPPEDDFYFKNGVPVPLKVVRGFTPKEQRIARSYMQSLEDGRRTGIYDSAIASRYDRMMRERDPENSGNLRRSGARDPEPPRHGTCTLWHRPRGGAWIQPRGHSLLRRWHSRSADLPLGRAGFYHQ